MNIQEIHNKKDWDDFFNGSGSVSFLQSWEWGKVKKEMGQEVLRLGLYEKEKLVAIALVEKMKSKRGKYLFVPHGPIISIQYPVFGIQKIIRVLRDFLIQLAKDEGYAFIRMAPSLENTEKNKKIFKDLGFRDAPIYIHSENFWVLSLTKTGSVEEPRQKRDKLRGKTESVKEIGDNELLSQMRKTTRYLIRKATRDGVVIEKRTDTKALDDFYEIYEKTVERGHFSPYSKNYIEKEFNAFNESGNALFLFGKHEGKILASALVLFTKTAGCYHQGASIHTKIPVPYLLQWEAIKEAKRRGCRFYNFWGILIKGRTPKDWDGLTTFKTGFGGYEVQYVPTQDYIISPLYYLTYIYEKFLQWKRGV